MVGSKPKVSKTPFRTTDKRDISLSPFPSPHKNFFSHQQQVNYFTVPQVKIINRFVYNMVSVSSIPQEYR